MALKVYKPYSAGTRTRIDLVREDLTTDRPFKGLTSGMKSNGGRGAGGRINWGIIAPGHIANKMAEAMQKSKLNLNLNINL